VLYSAVGSQKGWLLLCLPLEWLGDGLCSRITLAVCLSVVFRSSYAFSLSCRGPVGSNVLIFLISYDFHELKLGRRKSVERSVW